jgi:L-gulonolactone oxidase
VTSPVEVRTAAGDDIWLSPAYGRDTGYLAARAGAGEDGRELFDEMAAIMVPLGGRPQWGTVHPLAAADLAPRYPRWDDWQRVRHRLDPGGRLTNPETDRVLGPIG